MALFNSKKSNRRKSRSNRQRRHIRPLSMEGLEHRRVLAAIHDLDFSPAAEEQLAQAEQAEMIEHLDWLTQESFTFSEDTVESLESAIDACLDGQGVDLQSVSLHESGTYATGFFGIDLDFDFDATVEFSALEINDVELTMVPGSGDIPYYLELTVELEDITFDADVDVGIYVETGDGVTIDTEAEGTFEDVQFTLTFAPPREGVNEFSLDTVFADAALDASYATDVEITLTAQTKAALVTALSFTPALAGLGPFAPLAALGIVDSVTAHLENQLESELTGEIDDQLHLDVEDQLEDFGMTAEQIDTAVELIDFVFWTSAGTQTDCVELPYDTEAVEIHNVNYLEGTGAIYWVSPASEDSGILTAVAVGPLFMNQSSPRAYVPALPQYTVGLRQTDPRDLQAREQPTEPFFRPNPLAAMRGSSSVPGTHVQDAVDGQGTNGAIFVQYDLGTQETNSAAYVKYDLGGQGPHNWKVEEVSPDVIDPVAEDSWKVEELADSQGRKVEEVSADVIDLLAEDSWKVEELGGSHGWKVEELAEDSWKVEEASAEVIDLLAEASWKVEELAGSHSWKVEELSTLTVLRL